MVGADIQRIDASIRAAFINEFGNALARLYACGSLGREDFVFGWSDIDLLFVVDEITIDILRKIRAIELTLSTHHQTKVDIYAVPKLDVFNPRLAHGKLRNYAVHADRLRILIDQLDIAFVSWDILEDVDYSHFTILEYRKSLRRSVINSDFSNLKELQELFVRIVKIIFLILRVQYSSKIVLPVSYQDTLEILAESQQSSYFAPLARYLVFRSLASHRSLSRDRIIKEIQDSYLLFEDLSANLLQQSEN